MLAGIIGGGLVGLTAFIVYVRISDRIEKKRAEKRRSERSEKSK